MQSLDMWLNSVPTYLGKLQQKENPLKLHIIISLNREISSVRIAKLVNKRMKWSTVEIWYVSISDAHYQVGCAAIEFICKLVKKKRIEYEKGALIIFIYQFSRPDQMIDS